MTNHYELLALISGNYSDDEVSPIKEKIRSAIGKYQGSITWENDLGKRKLAYPIKHIRHGYYFIYEFDMSGEHLQQLERDMKLTPEVLRHQTVRRDPRAVRTPLTIDIRPKASAPADRPTAEPEKNVDQKVNLEELENKLEEILKGDIL